MRRPQRSHGYYCAIFSFSRGENTIQKKPNAFYDSCRRPTVWTRVKNECNPDLFTSLWGRKQQRNQQKWTNARGKRAKRVKHPKLLFFIANYAPSSSIRELKQPRRRQQQNPHKFACLTMKTIFLHALHVHFSSFWHFEDVLVLSTTWNEMFFSCVDDVSIWWHMFNFVFLIDFCHRNLM